MKDNLPPEEKLLKLIRGHKGKDLNPKETNPDNDSQKEKVTSLKFIPHLPQKYLSYPTRRHALLLVLGFLCGYLVFTLIYPWVALRKINFSRLGQEKIPNIKIGARLEVKPYEFYQKNIVGRQIFSSVSSTAEGPTTNVNLDLVQNLSLVGIVSGENPQAIIEDKKTQKTYYVTKEQFIGEFQVEEIQEGKITLGYKGQRFELYL